MPLFFHPDEQLLTVVNGSAKVTLVSPLYSENLPFDDKELMIISSVNTGDNFIQNYINLNYRYAFFFLSHT